MTTQTLIAEQNGRLCKADDRPLKDSNPYRPYTKSHDAFVRGYMGAPA